MSMDMLVVMELLITLFWMKSSTLTPCVFKLYNFSNEVILFEKKECRK